MGKPIEIRFQDEARIGRQGTLTRLWARRGTRPRAPRDRRYAWAHLFGAVCPDRAVGAGIVMPHADACAMNQHLAVISQAVAPGAHAVLVLDGAGYHQRAALDVPANITLLTLPPPDQVRGRLYSPELNPVENVWQYLRQNFLANRVHDDYDAILEACAHAWTSLMALPAQITSIAKRDWAKAVNT